MVALNMPYPLDPETAAAVDAAIQHHVIPWEELEENDDLPAQVLRSQDRGLLLEGCWADVVAFDPVWVGERGAFENPKPYCEGVEYVLVNGVPVIDRGEHTGTRSGMVVYGPGYTGDSSGF